MSTKSAASPGGWREPQGPSQPDGDLYDSIRNGDQVTIETRHGNLLKGRAVMLGPGGWVLNLGGAHGTPGIANRDNVVAVRKRRGASAERVASSFQASHPKVAGIPHEVVQVSGDVKEVWRFYLMEDGPSFTLYLNEYTEFKKVPPRKWVVSRYYARLNSRDSKMEKDGVPLPEDVVREVKDSIKQVIDTLPVTLGRR